MNDIRIMSKWNSDIQLLNKNLINIFHENRLDKVIYEIVGWLQQ